MYVHKGSGLYKDFLENILKNGHELLEKVS